MTAVSPRRVRRSVKIAGLLLAGTAMLLVAEALARWKVTHDRTKSARALPDPLSEYQMVDPDCSDSYLLRPGYAKSFDSALRIAINQEGFRGREIDPRHQRPRVLAIGDSCTFGGIYSYPTILEEQLRERGLEAEVINAGVEGYGTRHVLCRLAQFKALRPEISTIYLGWNQLFREDEPFRGLSRHVALLEILERGRASLRRRWYGANEVARQQLEARKQAARDADELRLLDGFVPSFLPELERFVDEMSACGSQVVLLTLPGLFVSGEAPSEKALVMGNLPAFTNNPFVFARMTEAYNDALRHLCRRRNLKLVDLAAWSLTALQPRDTYFSDSAHLDEAGQRKIGQYLAAELAPLLKR
jgi:hypothetical protein